jgi:ATP-dependent Lhr-like helicase
VSSVFLSLHESLQQVLAQRLDWTELREVQEQACRMIRAGSDALIIAPTAGGKSEAALIPVMDDLLKHGRPGVSCLYISPLKALINDQEERFRTFCTPTSLSVMKWHGDVARGERSWKEGEPPHFLMITPESLEVLLQEKTLVPDLRHVRSIIVDELHAFVESERGVHLKMLLHRMDQLTQRKIQRIGL